MEPNKNIISRTIDNKELANLLTKCGDSLSDCVNFGSNLLEWMVKSKQQPDNHDIVLGAILRHFLEQIDAYSELLKISISEPCLNLIRTLLEEFINASYILQTDYEQRGKAFLYFLFLENIKFIDKHGTGTKNEREPNVTIETDDSLNSIKFIQPSDAIVARAKVMESIQSPSYANIHAEYIKCKSLNKNNILKWYSLFGGPKSIKALADVTGNSGLYEYFYRYASEFVHSTKIISNGIYPQGIGRIRMPFHAQFVCSFSLTLSFIHFKKYIDYYCKEKLMEYSNFYASLSNFHQ